MIHHIAVVVKDLEKNKAFYQEVFSFPEIARETNGAVRPKGAWLQMGDVELHLQFREEESPKSDQHFAVTVKDLAAVCERANKMGAKVVESSPLTGFQKRAFVYDFDGNRIEVLQK